MHASRFTILLAIPLIATVILSACAQAPTPAPAPAPTTAPTTAPAAPAATSTVAAPAQAPAPAQAVGLKVSENSTLGKFIVDSAGRSLYVFLKDTKNTSNCNGGCAQTWPPLVSSAKPAVDGGIDASLLSTTTRQDGTAQVTFNGMPLYYYAPDQNPGDVKGQGVGGVWFVVSPAGNVMKGASSQNSSSAASSAASASSSASSSAPAAANMVGLKVSQTALGKFIVDSAGRTLYVFDKDTKNTSNCSGGCAQTWPPLTGVDMSHLQDGINAALLGTIQRKDGSSQATFNGMPLYYYTPDQNPGDVKGQGVGGVWWVVSPTGDPIKTSGAGSSAAPAPAPTQAPSSGGYGGYGQ